MRLWIDLANSPHVPFFRALANRFVAAGHEIEITAREFAETIPLARAAGFAPEVVGAHAGRAVSAKAGRLMSRAWALAAWARGRRFDLAISHNSYSQILAARALGLRTITLMDSGLIEAVYQRDTSKPDTQRYEVQAPEDGSQVELTALLDNNSKVVTTDAFKAADIVSEPVATSEARLPRATSSAAGAFDEPQHTMDSHSAAGPSVGALRGVRFASSGDQDSNAVYLRHFFGLVDRGLKDILNGEPLFLAGVREELALYRKTAKYPHIFESECHGNAEHSSLDQVAKHAAAGALREYRLAADRALGALPEIREKLAGDPAAVLKAATEGRARQIFAAEEGAPKEALNAAVVEGLRTGAEAFTYPGKELLEFGAIAAALRY